MTHLKQTTIVNVVGKGEIVCKQTFSHFPTMFSKVPLNYIFIRPFLKNGTYYGMVMSVRPFGFSALFSYILWAIELKFCIRLCSDVSQNKFTFPRISSIFEWVMPLFGLRIFVNFCMSYAFFIVSHYSLTTYSWTTLLTFYKETIFQNKEKTYKEVPDGRIMYRLRYSCLRFRISFSRSHWLQIFSSPMHEVQGELLWSHFVRRPSVVRRPSSIVNIWAC